MVTRKKVQEIVKSVLIEEFELEEDDLVPDAHLYEDLALDSLDGVDLVVALEKAFNFRISREEDEEKIRAIRTISDIYNFVDMKRAYA